MSFILTIILVAGILPILVYLYQILSKDSRDLTGLSLPLDQELPEVNTPVARSWWEKKRLAFNIVLLVSILFSLLLIYYRFRPASPLTDPNTANVPATLYKTLILHTLLGAVYFGLANLAFVFLGQKTKQRSLAANRLRFTILCWTASLIPFGITLALYYKSVITFFF